MKEEEIIKRYISRSNQNWGGATPEWVEKEFRQALQSYKDWLWSEIKELSWRHNDSGVTELEENTDYIKVSEIQSLIKPEKK